MGYTSMFTLGGITFDLMHGAKVYDWGSFIFTALYATLCITLCSLKGDK